MENKVERMKELIGILSNAAKAYYSESREVMSDFEYDKLYDELVALEAETGIVLAESLTQRVGYEVLSSLTKVRHESRMLSLDKTKSVPALADFLGGNEGMLSYKMDGLTVVLTYKNGTLFQAVTRGNGEVGEDITHNAKTFKNIPVKISFTGELVIRGEAVISFEDFNNINEDLEPDDQYKNPRNLCSGTVRQLNSEVCARRNVSLIAFQLVSAEGREGTDSKADDMSWLDSLGFETVERTLVTADKVEDAVRAFEEKIPTNRFATDGLVLTYTSKSYSQSLGTTAKFPRDSIAFKWQDEEAETTLKYIDWSTSRTGLINPVAVFEPVELEGTTVNRASVHNVSIVKNLKLGIGDKITVYKANMIIPQLSANLTQSGNIEIPKNCPVCGGETEIVSLRDGEALMCTNPNCKAQRVHSLVHFVSRDAMNIEGLSEATIEKFIEQGFIDKYPDVFDLEKYHDEIVELDGFGEKSFDKLIKAVKKAENVNLFAFIYALGINHVGLSNAKLLCKYYKNDFDAIMSAKATDLAEIEGFGEIIAASVEKYFANEENRALIETALKFITFNKEEETSENKLDGKIFVITGDVHHFKNRKELQNTIEALGGKATGSVSSKTNYLINNDVNSSSSKNKKAKELGVPIITEEEFLEIIK
jgi:DNA ligase (NAD+)